MGKRGGGGSRLISPPPPNWMRSKGRAGHKLDNSPKGVGGKWAQPQSSGGEGPFAPSLDQTRSGGEARHRTPSLPAMTVGSALPLPHSWAPTKARREGKRGRGAGGGMVIAPCHQWALPTVRREGSREGWQVDAGQMDLEHRGWGGAASDPKWRREEIGLDSGGGGAGEQGHT